MLNTDTKEARFCPLCGAGKPTERGGNYTHFGSYKCPSCGEEFAVVATESLEGIEALAFEDKLEDDDRKRLEWLEENRGELELHLKGFWLEGETTPQLDHLISSLRGLP